VSEEKDELPRSLPRGTQTDLEKKLAESLMWINLRDILVTELRRRADEGDQAAIDRLNWVTANWPGAGGPRHDEFLRLMRRIANLEHDLTNQHNLSRTYKARLDELHRTKRTQR